MSKFTDWVKELPLATGSRVIEAVKTTMIKLIKEGEISIWENSNL